MGSRRFSNCSAWTASLLAVLLWCVVPASRGSVPVPPIGRPSMQPTARPSMQQESQQGSQQCDTGQQNQSQQGANGGSAKNENGKNVCGGTKPAKKPAPLFGGSLSIKRSTQSTDSTALGFNGVDSNGQVQQALLNASPSSDSVKQVQALASYRPSTADLAAFQREGDLTSSSAAAKSN